MATCVNLPCADGGDRHCWEEVVVCIPIDISESQMLEAFEEDEICLTAEQFEKLGLDPRDYDDGSDLLPNECRFVSAEDAGIVAAVCPACGSDQVYDYDGNNITGI